MTPLFMHNFMKSLKIFFSNFEWGIVRTKEKMDESLKKKEKKGFKSHIAQDKHLNSVSLPIYREPLSSFFLSQLRSIFSTFLSPSHISTDAFPAKFSLFLSVALKISVGYKSDFSSHIFGWL